MSYGAVTGGGGAEECWFHWYRRSGVLRVVSRGGRVTSRRKRMV